MANQPHARREREGFQPDEPDRQEQATEQQQEQDTVIDMATGEAIPAPPPETWPLKVKLLHKKIKNAKNEEIDEISFREPTGADINRYGNPVRVNGELDIIIDERKMSLMMGALSGVLTPLLDRMDPRDWNSCAYRLRGFFLPDPSAW